MSFRNVCRTGASWICGAAVLCLLVTPLTAAAAPDEGATTIAVDSSDPSQVVLDYTFGPATTRTVDIAGLAYHELTLPGEPNLLQAGAPGLPHVARSILLPPSGDVTIEIGSAEYIEIQDVDLAPSKGNLLRTVDPATVPYVFDEKLYGTDAYFPQEVATLAPPYILRDYRGVVVDVNPFQYNPVQRTLRVYTSLSVAVHFEQPLDSAAMARLRPERALSRSFHDIYRQRFLNYSMPSRYTPLDEAGALLIICYDQWLPNIQPLVSHKNMIGLPTSAVGVSQVGATSSAIKSYIQNVYDTSDLAFVLLVGDSAQIPTPTASGGSSDPTYSKLAGGDNYPDIIVGRFSAQSAADVDTQVERTIDHESMPYAVSQAWFWKGMGIASNQGPGDDGEDDDEHMDNIRLDLLANGYTLVDQIYDPSASASQVANGLNNGRGIINYCGHGSTTSWGSSGFDNGDINALVNDGMLPFICSVACVNGQFAGYTCFGEAWLRATNNSTGNPTGAVGAYMSSINQSWDPPMAAEDEFVDRYVAGDYFSYGALCFAGSCLMMDEYGSGGVSMFDTWHIFGDPSLQVVGEPIPPTDLIVGGPELTEAAGNCGGPFTPGSATFTLTNNSDISLDFAITCQSDWLTITPATGVLQPNRTEPITVELNVSAQLLGDGFYTDTILFENLTNHDGDATRDFELTIGVPRAVQAYPLDSDPGWAVTGEWEFGDPAGLGGTNGYPDPFSGATGSNVFGVNLQGDYSTDMGGPYYLTMGPVDTTDVSQVSLRFKRWLNSDYEPYVSAMIEVSNDGSTWETVFANGGTAIKDNQWKSMSYDISAVADNQPAVYVRWGYSVNTSAAWAFSGWNVDDIQVWGLAPTPEGACCLSDGSCGAYTEVACGILGGTYQGDLTGCDPSPCAPAVCAGDANCDGLVNFQDVSYFKAALGSNQAAWEQMYQDNHGGDLPPCDFANCNADGVGGVDFQDIPAFLDLLGSSCD
jgi:hypothetical protein